jgi:hypothetical protein
MDQIQNICEAKTRGRCTSGDFVSAAYGYEAGQHSVAAGLGAAIGALLPVGGVIAPRMWKP